MDQSIELVPLVCVKCQSPIAAQPDEFVWVCAQCGQANLLDELQGLQPLDIYYASGIAPGMKGRPFWVADGRAAVSRQRFSGDKDQEALAFWRVPHRFYLPAYAVSLDTLVETTTRLLAEPPTLAPGEPVAFAPVTLSLADVQSAAEFVVMGIEAGRRDMLRQASVQVSLSPAVLVVLP